MESRAPKFRCGLLSRTIVSEICVSTTDRDPEPPPAHTDSSAQSSSAQSMAPSQSLSAPSLQLVSVASQVCGLNQTTSAPGLERLGSVTEKPSAVACAAMLVPSTTTCVGCSADANSMTASGPPAYST